jgi:hypothetical protein
MHELCMWENLTLWVLKWHFWNITSCMGKLCTYEKHHVLIHFQVCSQNCEKRLLALSCQSVHTEHLSFHWTNFYEILYLIIFLKSIKKIKFSLQYNKDNGNLHEDQCTLLIISCSVCLRMRNVSAKVVEKIELFSLKSCLLWDNVEKYCRARQATDDNMALAHCMLDT